MDGQKPGWQEYALIIVLVVVVVIVFLLLLRPQTTGIFTDVNNNF